ncbi:class I SAM-dependent methyltransferase [Bacillus sp. 2205SS5-2]|uniref:class I SAM-dependent methyltransferase n=1 Tax=Bacillus sp. 2205SS5-2 TaxID=3109031 RepID=UPI00300410B6
MTDHYYSRTPNVESNPVYWRVELRGNTFKFKTDQGVFSKNEVDYGSRLLIDVFQSPRVKGDLLDVGCGYGPIGLSLAKSSQDCTVSMVDVNERALSLAKENAENNNVHNVSIYESDELHSVVGEFAAIVTNPPIRAGKTVVHNILRQSFQHLLVGGELWVVIQKKQGAPSAQSKLEEIFGNVDVVVKKKGYHILRAQKH